MHSILRVLTSAVVPIIGLASCTVKNQAADETVPDRWKVPAPAVRDSDGAKKPLYKSLNGAISAATEIEFPGKDDEFAGVSMEIRSLCKTQGVESTQTLRLSNTRRIPVLSLVPANIWNRLDLTSANQSFCAFHFTLKNSLGSTQTMEIPSLQVTDVETAGALKVATMKVSAGDSSQLKLVSELAGTGEREAELICEHFKNRRRFFSGQALETVLQSLINGPIHEAGAGTDPRDAHLQQNCRLFLRSTHASTGLTRTEFTPAFKVDYSLVKILVSAGIGDAFTAMTPAQLAAGSLDMTKLQIMRVTLTNNSTATTAFKFPKPAANNFRLQRAGLAAGQYVVGPVFTMNLGWYMPHNLRSWSVDNAYIIEVPPGQSARIDGYLNGGELHCEFPYAFGSVAYQQIAKADAGFTYSIDQNMAIRQFVSWDPAKPDFEEKTVERNPLPALHLDGRGALPGFIPSPKWDELFNGRGPFAPRPELGETVGGCRTFPY